MLISSLVQRCRAHLAKASPWLVVAICVGVLIRVLGLAWIMKTQSPEIFAYGDAKGYLELAKHLFEGKGFVSYYEGEGLVKEMFRTPGLPLLLMPFVTKIGLPVYLFLQTIVSGILIPLFLWMIGRRLLSERAGVIAAWIGALELLTVVFSWFPLTETPFLIFGLASLAGFLYALEKKSWGWAIVSGLLGGYAVLIRPGNLFFFLMGFGGTAIWMWRQIYKSQIPNSKSQTIIKLPNDQSSKRFGHWYLRFWSLFGHWCLGFGAYRKVFVTLVALLMVFVTVAPWAIRNGQLSGSYTLTAAGWRNVYTDYVASIRAVEKKTTFWDEKAALKKDAMQANDWTKSDLNSPQATALLRQLALQEIWTHKFTVVKLQSMLAISYFTNDSYAAYLMRTGFLPARVGRLSPTYAVLTGGAGVVGKIFDEMRAQWFVPVFGRLIQFALILAALVGIWKARTPAKWIFVLIILFGFVSSSVIGLGVEGRLRVSVLPLIFLLAAAGIDALFKRSKRFR